MIRTERLVLREWTAADREPFAALNADPVVMEHFPAPLSRAESDALVDRIGVHFAEHGYGLWVVEAGGGFAGFTGLAWTDALGGRDLEVGWRLARWAWGRGWASEAAAAAVQHGLTQADEVVSLTALTNTRSQAVMRRIGLVRRGEFDHPRVPAGDPLRPHVVYATPQRWRPHSVLA